MAGFIQLLRAEPAETLLRYPNAFALLTLIALRARREVPQINPLGLQIGEAMVGDFAALGLTRQEFRSSICNLQKWSMITIRTTNKGTIAKLSDSSIYDINAGAPNQQTNQSITNQQPTDNQPITTNNKERKKEDKTYADLATPSSAGLALKAIKEKEKELDFISFWLPYYGDLPKRGSKADAKKQWLALSAATRALILTGLEAHRAEATRNGPDYLPYATTFLSQQRWKWDTFGTVSPTNALPSQPTTSAQFPMPGHELPGQVFYIAGRPGDYNMDKMAAESCLKHFPSSKVVSLAFPQVPYTMKDGNVIRG